MSGVPLYEFRCRTCDDTFEVRRPMSESGDPATCPQGHEGAVRLLSVFASVGGSAGAAPAAAAPRPAGGCGGACACAH
jgi:putative FmdB family regulatory protein